MAESTTDDTHTHQASLLRAPPQARMLAPTGIDVFSPYNGALLGRVPEDDAAAVGAAVGRARAAAPDWRARPLKERTAPLFRFRERVLCRLEELSMSAARESGKTLEEARAGVLKGVEVAEYALSLQNLELGGAQEVSRGVRCEVRREPLGVVAGITPFNFPAMVPMWMFPIAVTLGNTFLLKPSEKAPLTSALLAECMQEAGYPEGVFALVHGGAGAAEALLGHIDVAAVAFVGSSRVAAQVYARAASQGKRALALGGAKNVLILAPDADPTLAVPGVVASFTGCAGQRCMAGSLLVAVDGCGALIDGIVQRASQLRLGQDMGAIIDAGALSRLHGAIEQGLADGAELRLDGRQCAAPPGGEGGTWLGPTILDHVPPESRCAREELFGPVLSVVRVPSLDAALELERQSGYGNACSVFTRDGGVARHVADRSVSGMVGVNVGVPVPREPFSFGGTRSSRFGHGDITGSEGVAFWTQLKKVTSKWSEHTDGSWMS